MNGWLIAALLAGAASVPLGIWRAGVYRAANRLRHPVLSGIPLPATDDPRWRLEGRWAYFGAGYLHVAPCVPFAVDPSDGELKFEGKTIGHWVAYAKAVQAPLLKREQELAANRALAAICDDSAK